MKLSSAKSAASRLPALSACLTLVAVFRLTGCEFATEMAPVAAFDVNHVSGEAPLIVQFEDLSVPQVSPSMSWTWDFDDADSGDADSSTSQNPSHVYNESGDYTATLTITNSAGSDSVSMMISVSVGDGTVVSREVRVVDDIPTLTLETASGAQFDFVYTGNGEPPVEPGDILVGTDGDGFLRRVSSVTSFEKSGGAKGLVVQTEFASLNEAVEEGKLELGESIQFTSEDFTNAGVTLIWWNKPSISLSDIVVYDSDGLTVTMTSGSVKFAPAVDIEIEFSGRELTYFKTAGSGSFDIGFTAEVAADFGLSLTSNSAVIVPQTTIPFTGAVGPIPVKGTVTLSLVGSVSADIPAAFSVKTGSYFSTTATIGGEFVTLPSDALRSLSSLTLEEPGLIGPEWSDALGLSARVSIMPELEVSFYGVAATFFGAEFYVQFDMAAEPPPAMVDLTAGLDNVLSFDLGILNSDSLTATWDLDIPGPIFTLFEWTDTLGGGGEVTPGEMVSVSAGTFTMGRIGYHNEVPVHSVTLSAYEIGKFEVTNQEFADVLNWANEKGYLTTASTITVDAYGVQVLNVGNHECQISYSDGQFVVDTRNGLFMADHPVVHVTWYGAALYCNWLSEGQGLERCYNPVTWTFTSSKNGYHLPTEAQWERAAGWTGSSANVYGNGRDTISCFTVNYSFDRDIHAYLDLYCNPLGLSVFPYTSPVGNFPAGSSPVGAFDMSGNVSEWCSDWYDAEYYSSSPGTDPEGPTLGTRRVYRGGSWRYQGSYCRSSRRTNVYPAVVDGNTGFRLAR